MTVPSAGDHLMQARENRHHAEWLLASRPTDPTALQWAVTATFYCSMHALTAYLMNQGITTTTHTNRMRALADPANGVPANVLDAYRLLDDFGRGARYDLWVFIAQDVRDLLNQELAAIATFTGL